MLELLLKRKADLPLRFSALLVGSWKMPWSWIMTDDSESQRMHEYKLSNEKKGIVEITQERLDELVHKADDDTLTAVYMVGYHKRDDEVKKLTAERDAAIASRDCANAALISNTEQIMKITAERDTARSALAEAKKNHSASLDLLCDCVNQYLFKTNGEITHSFMSVEEELCDYLCNNGRMKEIRGEVYVFVEHKETGK